jgi:hypothetical protein
MWEVLQVVSSCESDGAHAHRNEVARQKTEAAIAAQKKWKEDLDAKNAVRLCTFLVDCFSCAAVF